MSETAETPAQLGYRMPAEWEPHAATWLSWPRREGISFPDAYDRVMPTFRAMVEAIAESEPVNINVCNGAHEAEAHAVLEGVAPECITYHRDPDERTVVPRSRADFPRARGGAAAGDCGLGLQRLGREVSAVRSR